MTTIGFDREAALAEIRKYLDTAPIAKEIGDVLKLDWKTACLPSNIVKTARELWEVGEATVAAVEVFKDNWSVKHGGQNITGEEAADLAISVLDAWVVWYGWGASIIEAMDAKLLRLIIEFALRGRRGVVWLSQAKAILGLVV